MQTNIVGIDIGDYSLRLVELAGGVIKKAASARTPDGLVRSGEILSMPAMADFLKETAKNGGIHRGRCAVILPDSLVYSRTVNMPVMTDQQLKYSLPYEFRDYVSEEKSRYFYDYAIQGMSKGEDGAEKEMSIFACAVSKDIIADYRGMLRQAGFSLKAAAPASCAFTGLMAFAENRTGTYGGDCCFIDLGYGSTDIYMINGHVFNTNRSLGIGVGDIISAAAESMNVDVHMAGSYVLSNYRNVLYSEQCMKIYSSIAVEIMKAVNFYNFSNRGNSLGIVYVCGGGASIAPLVEAVSKTLGIDVRRVDGIMPACEDADFTPAMYAGAVGIALGY